MSKLIVEVCKIDKIESLPNADKLVMATIKGWQCLVGKGIHTEGDLVIYVPPDAVVPQNLIEELKLDYLREHSGRVRTIKLRGYISQGLVIPASYFKKEKYFGGHDIIEGTDVAHRLGITKYEPPKSTRGEYTSKTTLQCFAELFEGLKIGKVSFSRFILKSYELFKSRLTKKRKGNPNFKEYTDLNNIKHYPTVFTDGEWVVITEKIHGTNFRAGNVLVQQNWFNKLIGKKGFEFLYGSHRVQKMPFSGKGFYGEDVYGVIAKRYDLANILPEGFTIYGEIYGPKIQELTYGANQLEVVFFDVKRDGKYLDYDAFYMFCKVHDLPMVPELFKGRYDPEILKLSTEGKTTLGGDHIREGAVLKPLMENYDNRCGRKILKSISPDYLLTKKQEKPEEFVDDNSEYAH